MAESQIPQEPQQRPEEPPRRRTPRPPAKPSRPAGPRKKRRLGLIFGLLGLVLLAAVAGMLLRGSSSKKGTAVETEKVTARSIVQTVTATGAIEPETQVKISPEVSGEIIFLGVQEGQSVSKGQVLVRINPEEIVAQRDEAQAVISAAQARLAQSRASLLRAQQDLSRMEGLHEKKLSTTQELQAAQAQVKISKAEQDAANFQVQQAQASARRIRESLGKTTIVAPISGTVTKLNSKLGEKVVGAIQMTGTEIMTIADLSVIEAVVDVSETDVVQVTLGDTAEVEVDAIPNQKFLAVVSRIANSPKQAGAGTQDQLTNFEVRLRFLQPDTRFRPGMTAMATIQTAKMENVLTVPIQSVTTRRSDSGWKQQKDSLEEDGARNVRFEGKEKQEKAQPMVFVQIGDSVVLRNVSTGIRDDQYIEVTEGVQAGDVVISGSYKAIDKDLENGSLVYVEPKESAGANEKGKGK